MSQYGAVVDPDWRSAVREELHPIDGSPVFTARPTSTAALPTLLLHGVGNNGAIFGPVLPRLARLGPLAAPTLSAELLADAEHAGPEAIAALIDWLEAAQAPPWRLVGHSMGGVLAGLVLRARPDLVSSAVLLNAPLPGTIERITGRDSVDRNGRAIIAMKALARISSFGRPRLPRFMRGAELGLVRTALRGFVVDPGRLDDDVITTAIMSSRTTDGIEFLELARHLPDWASDPHIDPPVEIVLGDRDPLITDADHAAVRRCYPAARVHVAQRCGHFAHLEQPELTLEIIEDFFATTAPRTAR